MLVMQVDLLGIHKGLIFLEDLVPLSLLRKIPILLHLRSNLKQVYIHEIQCFRTVNYIVYHWITIELLYALITFNRV